MLLGVDIAKSLLLNMQPLPKNLLNKILQLKLLKLMQPSILSLLRNTEFKVTQHLNGLLMGNLPIIKGVEQKKKLSHGLIREQVHLQENLQLLNLKNKFQLIISLLLLLEKTVKSSRLSKLLHLLMTSEPSFTHLRLKLLQSMGLLEAKLLFSESLKNQS